MKKIVINAFIALALITGLTSCTDEQDLMISSPKGSFTIKSPQSGEAVFLSPTTPLNPGLSLSWNAMDYTSPTQVSYAIQVVKTGNSFDTPIVITTTSNTFATVTSADLNSAAVAAGLTPFTQGSLDVRIASTVAGTQEAYSNVINYLVTPYTTELPKLYVVGNFLSASGYGNDWTPSAGAPLAASGFGATDFEGFVYFNSASFEYKFLPTNVNFDGDYGDDGSFSGVLVQTGEVNCTGSGAGFYYMKANTGTTGATALSYSIAKTSWAITGSATPLNWPSGPDGTSGQDQDMTYNQTTKKWEITIALTAGGNKFKFRANDAWGINLGGDGGDADSAMDFGGPDLEVPAAGTYKVELDLSHPRNYSWTATLQ